MYLKRGGGREENKSNCCDFEGGKGLSLLSPELKTCFQKCFMLAEVFRKTFDRQSDDIKS